MYSTEFIIEALLDVMKAKEYGFKDVNHVFKNSQVEDWEVVETIEISPERCIKGFDPLFGCFDNKTKSVVINELNGDFMAMPIHEKGYLRRIEYKKDFNLSSLDIIDNDSCFRPYVYLFENEEGIYFPYKYKIEEVFDFSISSYLSPEDDLDTYLDERKNRNYFKTILNERLLSSSNKSRDYTEMVKKMLKIDNEGVDGAIAVFNKIKNDYDPQDVAVIVEIIEEINLTHYSINNGGDCGKFSFAVRNVEDDVNTEDSFSLVVLENFYNNDEICSYGFHAKEEYLFDRNYLREAVNTMVLMFAPSDIK